MKRSCISAIFAVSVAVCLGACGCSPSESPSASADRETVSTTASSSVVASASGQDASETITSSDGDAFPGKPASSDLSSSDETGASASQASSVPEWEPMTMDDVDETTWRMVMSSIMTQDGSALGGWWLVGGADPATYIYFSESFDGGEYRVLVNDGNGEYGYTVADSGTIASLDPVPAGITGEPFVPLTEMTITLSNGNSYLWRKDNSDVLMQTSDPQDDTMIASDIHRANEVPTDAKMFLERQMSAEYGEEAADIADMVLVDGKQQLTGTIMFGDIFTRPTTDPEYVQEVSLEHGFAALVLDTPTFVEGDASNGYGRGFRAVDYLALLTDNIDWKALVGQRVTIQFDADDTFFPSDVRGFEAGTSKAALV